MKPVIVGVLALLLIVVSPLILVAAYDWGWRSVLVWLSVLVITHLTGMVALQTWNPWRVLWRAINEDLNIGERQ